MAGHPGCKSLEELVECMCQHCHVWRMKNTELTKMVSEWIGKERTKALCQHHYIGRGIQQFRCGEFEVEVDSFPIEKKYKIETPNSALVGLTRKQLADLMVVLEKVVNET